MVIPIFIIVHNQLEVLKKSVRSYETLIGTPIRIVFHDVASTYYETLLYLEDMKKAGYTVYRSNQNDHHSVLQSIRHYVGMYPECEHVVMTDPDIELFQVNPDILELYVYMLQTLKKQSVGPMLKIDDIPDTYYNREAAITGHSKQFWNLPQKSVDFRGQSFKYVECSTDTTFQLFSAKKIPASFPHSNSARTLHPYSARHLDWYVNANSITPCQLMYAMTGTAISHWNNSRWAGTYYQKHVRSICEAFTVRNDRVYYQNVCKGSKNGFNFGEHITPFIYRSLFHREPVLNQTGSKQRVVFGSGSILSQVTDQSVVWGTGFMFGTEKICKPEQILSVRGPLTRKRIVELGYPCPEVYGDIGLILPYFYSPTVPYKRYELGIIPHYVDSEVVHQQVETKDSTVCVIDVTRPVHEVVDQILQCKQIASSSLHGLITSHAYGIPAIWIRFNNKKSIGGSPFKFHDYYGSLNISQHFLSIEPFLFRTYGRTTPHEIQAALKTFPNPTFPVKTKHIVQLCPFINVSHKLL